MTAENIPMNERCTDDGRQRLCGVTKRARNGRPAGQLLLLAFLCVFFGTSNAYADPGLVWRIEGTENNVYLLGSIHLLREQDHPLPTTFETAYRDADMLVMELDMDDLDPLKAQQIMLTRGLATDGRNLRSIMGDADYAEAQKRIRALELELPFLDGMEPWFAALTLLNLQFLRLGLDPNQGVEAWFTHKAAADGKEIIGLETLDEQLELFDSMPDNTQSDFLLLSLRDAENMDGDLRRLVSAWKRGDTNALERELLGDFRSIPTAYQKLVVERNRAWSGVVSKFTASDRDYLVIVGALHLVGPDSLVSMLERHGYEVSRVMH